MSLYCFDLVASGITSVSVHDKSYMLWNWTLPQGANEKLSNLINAPFDWRGFQHPFSKLGEVWGRHDIEMPNV